MSEPMNSKRTVPLKWNQISWDIHGWLVGVEISLLIRKKPTSLRLKVVENTSSGSTRYLWSREGPVFLSWCQKNLVMCTSLPHDTSFVVWKLQSWRHREKKLRLGTMWGQMRAPRKVEASGTVNSTIEVFMERSWDLTTHGRVRVSKERS